MVGLAAPHALSPLPIQPKARTLLSLKRDLTLIRELSVVVLK